MRVKEFDTGINCKKKVLEILSSHKDSSKKGKSEVEIAGDLGISLDTLNKVIKAKKDADSLQGGKFLLSGRSWVLENGNVARFYSRAGELMVQCIEDAYKDELKFQVPITGEYLCGRTWGDAH